MDQLSRINLAQRKLEACEHILWNYVNEPELVTVMKHLADASRHLASLKKELEWHRAPTTSKRYAKSDRAKDVT